MSSACRSSRCCVDAKSPVRASYKVLYKWPESDVAFAKSAAAVQSRRHELPHVGSFSSIEARAPAVVDGYSCRQLYLRSYTFTKKETVPQRTRRCMRKLKDGTAVFPIFSAAAARTIEDRSESKTVKKNKMKSALHSVFHRLLFCATKIEVAD
ncbi:uncharacterized protein LOC122050540 [Zingiber officinale]|uniref:Uncharacterized protein n=1 Tax=Zingiber officinale TaxID=94328 RepID=A0A8J5LM95_ZINOF|nr:uncharacterized protein LOC122050540 [Zingiber officinale]KAG6521519.1 hypothetical protein ZIOFF_018642 [Zingiber officinale]